MKGMGGIGIIGLGYMGLHHLKLLRQLQADEVFPNMHVAMVCDVDYEQAKIVGEKYKLPWNTDPQSAILHPSIDTVFIASPTQFHYEQASLALDARKNVYCEKPLAEDGDATQKLRAKVQSGSVNQVGFVLRHSPVIHHIRKVIERGDIGHIERVVFSANSCVPKTEYGLYRTNWKLHHSARGILQEESIHDIDTFADLFGRISVESVTFDRMSPEYIAETAVRAHLRCGDIPIQYASMWHDVVQRGQRHLEITGTRGTVHADYFVEGWVRVQRGKKVKQYTPSELKTLHCNDVGIDFSLKQYHWYSTFADHAFLRACSLQTEAIPTFSDAAEVAEVLDAMYEVARWK